MRLTGARSTLIAGRHHQYGRRYRPRRPPQAGADRTDPTVAVFSTSSRRIVQESAAVHGTSAAPGGVDRHGARASRVRRIPHVVEERGSGPAAAGRGTQGAGSTALIDAQASPAATRRSRYSASMRKLDIFNHLY